MYIKAGGISNHIGIKRGVRQGDSMSPKLFIMALEDVFHCINWSAKSINIDRKWLTLLRFADDVMLFCNTEEEFA